MLLKGGTLEYKSLLLINRSLEPLFYKGCFLPSKSQSTKKHTK